MLEAEEDFQSSKTLVGSCSQNITASSTPLSATTGIKTTIWSFVIVFSFRNVSKFCKDRNIVGTSARFVKRVLTSDEVVTKERCQKYFISCQRCCHHQVSNCYYHILRLLGSIPNLSLYCKVHGCLSGRSHRSHCAAEDQGDEEVPSGPSCA